MSSSGSASGDSNLEYKLALRIALERSKAETGGSSGSGASSQPPAPRRRISDAGAGPSRAMGSGDRWPAQSAPAGRAPSRRALPPPAAAPPAGQRWVLVPAPLTRTRTPESEARVARRERQRRREREAAETANERVRALADLDEDHLLSWVCHRSLTTAESDARRLRRKNAKALRIAIEESERLAAVTAKERAKLAKLKRRQDRAAERLKGLVIVSNSSSSDDGGSSSDDDQPPAADGYSYAGDRKGKGPARKY